MRDRDRAIRPGVGAAMLIMMSYIEHAPPAGVIPLFVGLAMLAYTLILAKKNSD